MGILATTVIGLLVGILGTGAGGVLGLWFNLRGRNSLSFLLAASGGVMISISLVELVPEAIEVGNKGWAAVGLLLGTLALFVLDMLLPHTHNALVRAGKGQERGAYHGQKMTKLRSMGLLIGLGIAMHNIPEGLAIGAAYAHEEALGIGVAFLIAAQNIPEGMAMAVPLRAGKVRTLDIILSTMAAGLPMGLGALVGAVFGAISPPFLSISLGFAAGAMMYVVSDELIPEAHLCGSEQYPTIGLVTGIFIGVVAIFIM
ncbi:MAG: ZIP family metal transporter [Candidatus Fermentithermobacillus carboniphilus]|uniref:ZIP family metal transporter n=1 Tax=Candidatus Fermentithermobacillus carboniphilus TaxID=3085328 RepID=A0AAT9LBR4_9FIRM|nr:MAG: ZIP family metal transporter [Candidatus Fermentithermobacillus carboniphilus]